MTHDFRFAYFLIMLAALCTCSLLLRKTHDVTMVTDYGGSGIFRAVRR